MLLSASATVQSRTRVFGFACLWSLVLLVALVLIAASFELVTLGLIILGATRFAIVSQRRCLYVTYGCPKYLVAEAHIHVHVHVVCTNALCAYCAYANAWSFRMEPARSIVRF